MSSDIEWKTLEKDNMRYIYCDLGPFRGLIIEAATVDMNINFVWAVIDLKNNKTLHEGLHKITHMITLISNTAKIDALNDCMNKTETHLRRVYEDYMIEQIVLGGNSD